VPDELAPSGRGKWCLIPGIAVKAAGWAHAVVRRNPEYFVMPENRAPAIYGQSQLNVDVWEALNSIWPSLRAQRSNPAY